MNQLRSQLLQLDNRGYKAYKDIQGSYQFSNFTLIIDRVQGDPFASPSQVRVQVSQEIAQFPDYLYQNHSREVALRDYIIRQFEQVARRFSSRKGTGNSGLIAIKKVGQEILDRSAVLINSEIIEVRFVVGLPAGGRNILGRKAVEMLCEDIPKIVDQALIYSRLNSTEIQYYVETAEDTEALRNQLELRGLIAFVADGAILPRSSGADDRPMSLNAFAFQSPPELKVELTSPNRGAITGMGIPKGITLIVGGGYHGKSTLLKAIALGIYNHIPEDGRQFVVTSPTAVKIRAEDGRSIAGVDISPFINHLPHSQSTTHFSTPNASGSTSQAANIIEALEVGAKVLLVDEDTAATNFMIRDRRMQQLIAKDKEPITPFIDKICQLYTEKNVSTILVMGGSGDYFDVADTVIAMENFQPQDVTQKAKAIALQYATERTLEGGTEFGNLTPRVPLPESIDPSRGRREVRTKVIDTNEVIFGTEAIDLTAIEQIIDPGQLKAIAAAMIYAKSTYLNGHRSLSEIIDSVLTDIQLQSLDILTDFPQGDSIAFRRFELAAAINRLRTLEIKK